MKLKRTVPDEFLTSQIAFQGFDAPTEKEPVGSKVMTCPTATENPATGDRITAVGAAGTETVIVTDAVPEIEPEVAVTVNEPPVVPAVNNPELEMVPPDADHTTVTDTVDPSDIFPDAVNCWV